MERDFFVRTSYTFERTGGVIDSIEKNVNVRTLIPPTPLIFRAVPISVHATQHPTTPHYLDDIIWMNNDDGLRG